MKRLLSACVLLIGCAATPPPVTDRASPKAVALGIEDWKLAGSARVKAGNILLKTSCTAVSLIKAQPSLKQGRWKLAVAYREETPGTCDNALVYLTRGGEKHAMPLRSVGRVMERCPVDLVEDATLEIAISYSGGLPCMGTLVVEHVALLPAEGAWDKDGCSKLATEMDERLERNDYAGAVALSSKR